MTEAEVMHRIKPIRRELEAKPHRPVYRMHRYFARRPYSVFAGLINHYTEGKDVILDPFTGGGVTIVEGVLQGRRTIGYDINPLATFITKMEVSDVDVGKLEEMLQTVCAEFGPDNDRLFRTNCRQCGAIVTANWFEYSAIVDCNSCKREFRIHEAKKAAIGSWICPHCHAEVRFSPAADTRFDLISVFYACPVCANEEVTSPNDSDHTRVIELSNELAKEEEAGLWIPDEAIPDNNMQRESALFKKGIIKYRQFFTDRHLLALGRLKQVIVNSDGPLRDWLLFAFSSTLRYTNRMVTRNIPWRGTRPLEWAKPGFWLPPIHLEANVLQEFARRGDAILRGKRDFKRNLNGILPMDTRTGVEVLASSNPGTFHVTTRSSTELPLPNNCIDAIITDPPYGSYVFYADLCNFWGVWLPEIEGLGRNIDSAEEAVIARKKFPGAKDSHDYQRILERVFIECSRVLKPMGLMVMTFNNREPRAWASLMVAATKAGFRISEDGVLFQSGIPSYRHTAQSRREGSVRGDFILTFERRVGPLSLRGSHERVSIAEGDVVAVITNILKERGPLIPSDLFSQFYSVFYGDLAKKIEEAVHRGDRATEQFITDLDKVRLFDSHRKQLLEQHFVYNHGKWSLKH